MTTEAVYTLNKLIRESYYLMPDLTFSQRIELFTNDIKVIAHIPARRPVIDCKIHGPNIKYARTCIKCYFEKAIRNKKR